MMEQDFDEIGKRLYDFEATPPDNGWKRIGGTLNGVHPTGGVSWLRRNWWLPFTLILPAFLYLGYHGLDGTSHTLALNVDVASFEKREDASREPHVVAPTSEQLQYAEAVKSGIHASEEQAKGREVSGSLSPRTSEVLNTYDTHLSQKIISNTPLIINNDNNSEASDSRQSTTSQTTNNGDVTKYAEGAVLRGALIANIPTYERSLDSHDGTGVVSIVGQGVTNEDSANLKVTAEVDSISMESELGKSAEEPRPAWRINVSIMPQYVNRTIQPLPTDEVFITKAEGKNSPTRTGLDIGIGVARSLSNSWYLDARLSYNNFSQEITHSYSDGKVDTLIRVKQPDESVRVTPVYHVTNRQIKSEYHYASLSLGTTYYFWSRAKSRFNLSASADMHYLLSSQIKEKVNGQWVSLGDNTPNKINYSFTLGAGYNITLYKGLELMIRPSLRYFTSDIKSTELPYKLNQRSVGISFMLSKTI